MFVSDEIGEPASWKPGSEIHQLLNKKSFATMNEFHLYEKENHGFVTRGDTKNAATREAIQDCLNKIVVFLHKFD